VARKAYGSRPFRLPDVTGHRLRHGDKEHGITIRFCHFRAVTEDAACRRSRWLLVELIYAPMPNRACRRLRCGSGAPRPPSKVKWLPRNARRDRRFDPVANLANVEFAPAQTSPSATRPAPA